MSAGTTDYMVRTFGPDRRMIRAQRILANTDVEAIAIARAMVDGAAEVVRFDLWEDTSSVHEEALTMRAQLRPHGRREWSEANPHRSP